MQGVLIRYAAYKVLFKCLVSIALCIPNVPHGTRVNMFENVLWNFDISSFMVLLGEQEEANFRLMHRGLLECFCAAPVAGLQSYIRSEYVLCESTGPTYFSPYGQNHAPLRNMRLVRALTVCRILESSRFSVYQIKNRRNIRIWSDHLLACTWLSFSWIVLGSVLLWLALTAMTWIGNANCVVLVLGSIVLRLVDRYTLRQAPSRVSFGDDPDAAFILGKRNSCLVIEGSRAEVSKWTGLGVEPRIGSYFAAVRYFARCLALSMLVFVFSTIPNGSFPDQMAFIALNILAQINVVVGQHLAARRCMRYFDQVDQQTCPTRTHVYGFLIRRYGNGKWVDATGMLPSAPAWVLWRSRILNSKADVKTLWDLCAIEAKQMAKPSDRPNSASLPSSGV